METKKYRDFGDALTNVLAFKGLSQKQFCDITNVNKSQASKWMSGSTTPRLPTKIEIGRLLGVIFEDMPDGSVSVRKRRAADYLNDPVFDGLPEEPSLPAGQQDRDALLKHLELIQVSAQIVADGLRKMK
jgi:transcriptional regulator with XRE-family HTH domain